MALSIAAGVLLYGPPGTGKTLMARQIGRMLRAREPKIVNGAWALRWRASPHVAPFLRVRGSSHTKAVAPGPEILNKYVGQSEENIRNLFADAEAEVRPGTARPARALHRLTLRPPSVSRWCSHGPQYKAKKDESQLHIIIFDELDAICKQRGSRNDGTGVGDSVVNQLLAKVRWPGRERPGMAPPANDPLSAVRRAHCPVSQMDGVDQLNNILIIGMTNRKDMIDEALLRPGRLEVHVEISLPNLEGRVQILNIHTATVRASARCPCPPRARHPADPRGAAHRAAPRTLQARKHNRLSDDVDLRKIAELTKNFSGAEIEGARSRAAAAARPPRALTVTRRRRLHARHRCAQAW